MSYELFEKAAALNAEFEVIPTRTSILAKGIAIDKNGYMQYKGETYLTNMVKLLDLPAELRNLFMEKQLPVQKSTQEVVRPQENKFPVETQEKKTDRLQDLNNILFEQLQNIVDPEEGTNIDHELKKANAVCNIADKIINIADLSLKAEMFHDKKTSSNRSLYRS